MRNRRHVALKKKSRSHPADKLSALQFSAETVYSVSFGSVFNLFYLHSAAEAVLI